MNAEELARGIAPNIHQVVMALSGEYQPAPRSFSRQLTASAVMRRPDLIEREWQHGCARVTYYRLSATGLAVQAAQRAIIAGEGG